MYLLLSYYLVLCRHSFVKTFAQLQVQPMSLSAFPLQEDNADIHKGIKVMYRPTQLKADY